MFSSFSIFALICLGYFFNLVEGMQVTHIIVVYINLDKCGKALRHDLHRYLNPD